MAEKILDIDSDTDMRSLFGDYDKNIKMIEEIYDVSVLTSNDNLKIVGENSNTMDAAKAISSMASLLKQGDVLNEQNIKYITTLVNNGRENELRNLSDSVIYVTEKGKPIKPKTLGQRQYIRLINNKTITFGIGPAGTGKTYLAVAMAVKAFKTRQVDRIILTRPAVEAGEKLGFLPGDIQMKVDPYLRPLYDSLFEMLGTENFYKYLERGNIEIAPLAYMRGRTLDDSFIILDEAQNTTPEQMKMFLTRLGQNSKAVITGDVTQIDLGNQKSGLMESTEILKDIDDIGIMFLNEQDVVRHALVQKIIIAYDNYFSKGSDKDENKSYDNKRTKSN